MDSLSGFTVFARIAETRNIVGATRALGVSASVVGKRVARLEGKLGMRLFHRSARNITLTAESNLFLERSQCTLAEIEAIKLGLPQSREAPHERLQVSLPLVSGLILPALTDFMQTYPGIELDLNFSDRAVDVVDGGFDVVLRTSQPVDSWLSMRELGEFQLELVGSPIYFARHDTPHCPEDLSRHTCLHYRLSNTGRLKGWPLCRANGEAPPQILVSVVCNNIETRVCFALRDQGITCLPDFSIREALHEGRLVSILDAFCECRARFFLSWPSSRQVSPKLHIFIDFAAPRVIATLDWSAPGRTGRAGGGQEQDRGSHGASSRYIRPLPGRIRDRHRDADLLHGDQEV